MGDMAKITGYTLGPVVGRGGMSIVYQAVREATGETLAVKVFTVPEGPNRMALAHKFTQEARLLAVLDHPNLVRTHDSGLTADSTPWLAMDLIPSEPGTNATLAAKLSTPQPFPPDEIVNLYVQIRAALAYCHAQGIVHGDVKAENILLAPDGSVKLADFGIARILEPTTRAELGISTVTLDGALCTPYIRAPECRDGSKPTAAADIYAFGVLLYRLVAGIWYEGSARLLAQAAVFAPGWDRLLVKMLAANPDDRFPDATALPENPREDPPPHTRRRFIIAGGGVLAALLGGSAYWWFFLQKETDPKESMTDKERIDAAGYYPDGNFDYVKSATYRASDKMVLTRPVYFGFLCLPDHSGPVVVIPPPNRFGVFLAVHRKEGYLYDRLHVKKSPHYRVLVSHMYIRLAPPRT